MKNLLIEFGFWLLAKCGLDVEIKKPRNILDVGPEVLNLLETARRLVAMVDPGPESGEWKRHTVYSRLIKLFPASAKRDLALAIELALR